jgi:hypothetical protein
MDLSLSPTVGGSALAALAIAAGAPWFGDGLRALRLRREFAALHETPIVESPPGLAQVRGEVLLESPLFAPLSGRPCAGFRLEVQLAGARASAAIDVRRPFRLREGENMARVFAERGIWQLDVTGERTVAANAPLGTQLESLLASTAETRWARGLGRELRLVERALLAGATCHVIGQVREAHPFEQPAEIEWARTGTDDRVALETASRVSHEPVYWIDEGGHLEFTWVSSHAPARSELRIASLRLLGLALGTGSRPRRPPLSRKRRGSPPRAGSALTQWRSPSSSRSTRPPRSSAARSCSRGGFARCARSSSFATRRPRRSVPWRWGSSR